MNIKSLLLGSVAALVATTGARAADAVVLADPEPVEYVRVCDVYGVGYFYIPGTETCLRIGGYVRYQFSGGDLFDRDPIDQEDFLEDGIIDTNDAWNQYSRLSLQTLTGTETELGTLKTFTETRFQFGTSGSDNIAENEEVSLNFAWIELGGFRVGKDESVFTTFTDYAGGVIADDLVPYGPFDTNLISYTFTAGSFAGIVSLEEGSGIDTIDSYVPHVVAGAKFTQGWGGIAVVGSYDSNFETFAVKARLDVKATDTISAFVMAGYGEEDDLDRSFYKTWDGDYAVWAGLTAQVSEKAKINLQVAYADGDDSDIPGVDDEDGDFAASLNVNYEIVPGLVITPEIDYASDGDAGSFDDPDDDDAFGGILRFQRSF